MTLDQLKALLRDVLEKEKKRPSGPWRFEQRPGWVGVILHDPKGCSNCPVLSFDSRSERGKTLGNFIALARNVSPAMAKALLGEIEAHEQVIKRANLDNATMYDSCVSNFAEHRLAAILAQFTQTPTL